MLWYRLLFVPFTMAWPLVNAFTISVVPRAHHLSVVVGKTPLFAASLEDEDHKSRNTATAPITPVPAAKPHIRRLTSLNDFLNYLDETPKDSLAVIKFYTKSCSLCKRIGPKYKKMAHRYQNVLICFAEVEQKVNPELFATLGVNTFPFIQIYRNDQCVAAQGTFSDKVFEPMVNDTIQRELSMSPEDWDSFLETFAEPIRQSAEKVEQLRSMRDSWTK